MTTESDIHFGDLEESTPETRLRPDQNKHYAVAEYEQPSGRDLPVYVDVDVLRDIELHAQDDTSVELGGVLLGGQYLDRDGKPFVLVSDSLRAEHYESTKGSFKFTHDTWSAITRERDEFPDDLQMVGWYHTHPGWGVFLSTMDMFICDNFFNKQLDVAYVVDPCRGDRGMFQWTGDAEDRVRRTDGFFVIGSRFRKDELEYFSAQLEGGAEMAHDPRFGGAAGPYPAPVVNIAEQRSPWVGVATLGMLMVQFVLLALLVWRITGPAQVETAPAEADRDQSELVAELKESLDAMREARRLRAQAESETRALDRVVTQLQNAPAGSVESLVEQQRLNEELRASILGHAAMRQDIEAQKNELENEMRRAKADADWQQGQLQGKVDEMRTSHEELRQRSNEKSDQIAKLQQRLERYEPSANKDAEGGEAVFAGLAMRWWYVIGGAVVVGVAALCVFGAFSGRKDDEDDELVDKEEAEPANNIQGGPA